MTFPIPEPVEQLDRPRGALRIRPRSSGNFHQHCNVVYGETHGLGLVMDIFQPLHGANGYAIVDVISGAWHSDRARLNEHIGLGAIDAFCGAGFTVFAAAPGSASLFTVTQMVEHLHGAIRYAKNHAAAWSVDPERLGLSGVSAGGHLAALTALTPQDADPRARLPWYKHDTKVAAVGLFFPPTDFLDYGGRPFNFAWESDLSIARMLFPDGIAGQDSGKISAAAREISPLHQIKGGHPPFLLAHATGDNIVPYSQSRRFVDALVAAGVESTLITHDGDGHPWRGVDRECTRMATWFVDKLGVAGA
jgi:acetyl esterase/lipase